MCIALSLPGFFLTVLKFSNIKLVYQKVEKIQVVSFKSFVTIFRIHLKTIPYSNLQKKKKNPVNLL